MAFVRSLGRWLLVATLVMPALAGAQPESLPGEVLIPLKKLYSAGRVRERTRLTWDQATARVQSMFPGAKEEDARWVQAAFDRYDFESELLNRWGGLFSVAEWQVLNGYLDEIGLKQVAALRSIIDDATELGKGPEFVEMRAQTFIENLSREELDAVKAFWKTPLAGRFWRVLILMEDDVPKIALERAGATLSEIGERIRQRGEREKQLTEETFAAEAQTGAEGEVVYGASEVDQVPLLRERADVQYPPELAQLKIKGRVTVAFVVNRHGQTESARVIKATDDRFGPACLEAVRNTRYRPALRFKEKVSCRVVQEFLIFPPVEE